MGSQRYRKRISAGVAALLLVVAGCEATAPPAMDVLAGFDAGAAQEEVLAVLPPGELTPTDQITDAQLYNGYLIDQYLIEGRPVEVLWVHDPVAGLPADEFRANLTPLVFSEGALDGIGWSHLDRRVEEWGLPDRWATPPPGPAEEPREMTSF